MKHQRYTEVKEDKAVKLALQSTQTGIELPSLPLKKNSNRSRRNGIETKHQRYTEGERRTRS